MTDPVRARAKGDVRTERVPRLRRAMARRMTESVTTVPQFHLRMRVRVEALTDLRAALAAQRADGRRAPSLTDLLVKTCGIALRRHPEVNASFVDGQMEFYERVNVGVATAVPTGLVVPVVRDADRLSADEIAGTTSALVERARAGRLTQDDIDGGTFTLSNLGMFGIESFDAIVNPPESAILSVGAASGEGPARSMVLTLGCDHRALTGAEGAHFLATVNELIEHPGALAD